MFRVICKCSSASFKISSHSMLMGFPSSSDGKASACNVGDPGSNPGSGKSAREGNGNPLKYSCLDNFMDRGAQRAIVHGVLKSETGLSGLHNSMLICFSKYNPSFRVQFSLKFLVKYNALDFPIVCQDLSVLVNCKTQSWHHFHKVLYRKITSVHVVVFLGVLCSFCLGACSVPSVISDFLRPHRLQPTRLLCPWNFPGKNAGVGCHFLLQGISPAQGWNPVSPVSLAVHVDSLPLTHQGSPRLNNPASGDFLQETRRGLQASDLPFSPASQKS